MSHRRPKSSARWPGNSLSSRHPLRGLRHHRPDGQAKSPLKPTFTIELANGYFGYIPPPEAHKLGGYTSWRARSSCLEVQAEPKILAATLDLLASVAGHRCTRICVRHTVATPASVPSV
jgi:hypothetical protein